MNKEAVLYFVAAGLFAGAAGIHVGSNAAIGLVPVVLLAAGVVMGWLGDRKLRNAD